MVTLPINATMASNLKKKKSLVSMVIMLTGDFHSLSEPSNILGEVLLSTSNYTTITETLRCSLAYCADLLLSWKVVL